MPQPDIRTKPLSNGWPNLDEAEVLAIKAVGGGVANEGQQKTFLDVLMNKISCYASMTFADNQKDQDFGEGRRFVGHVIQEILTTPALEKQDVRRGKQFPRAARYPTEGDPRAVTGKQVI